MHLSHLLVLTIRIGCTTVLNVVNFGKILNIILLGCEFVPSVKTKKGASMNKDLMRAAGFGDVEAGKCPLCGKDINVESEFPEKSGIFLEFRDELSRKEFNISGLCQKCQDEMFKEY